ncbi:MAG: germination protein YpeB [Bacillota bacterium]|jgi:spore germination protein
MRLNDLSLKDHWLKRNWPAFVLTIILLGTFVWGLTQYRAKTQLNTFVENSYQRSFYEMIQNVENVEVLLAKGLVSNSPRQNIVLFSNVWREAYSAQEKLSQLPIAHELIERTSKFLNQIGDFSFTLARQIADKQDLSAEQRNSLQSLQKEADFLSTELHALRNSIGTNQFAWADMRQTGTAKFREVAPQLSEVSFQKINTQIEGTPTLIYDGPFSDHINQMKPLGVTGEAISAEEAARIAMEKADLLPNVQYTPTQMGTGEGTIPIYRIHITPSQGQTQDQIIMDISQTGGHVVTYLNSRPVEGVGLNGVQAQEKAIDYLKKKGFPDLTVTYAQVDDSSATIAFAGVLDGVILYPDQIKVKVALDNGQIIGVDALGYLMSHHPRQLVKPRVSEDEVRTQVADRLNIEHVRQAIIPLETRREVQCWEVKGNWQEEDFYLYYNVLDGNEEKILKVIKTPQGPLTV